MASAFCLFSTILSKLETARCVLIHEMILQRVKLEWACDGESLRSPKSVCSEMHVIKHMSNSISVLSPFSWKLQPPL